MAVYNSFLSQLKWYGKVILADYHMVLCTSVSMYACM